MKELEVSKLCGNLEVLESSAHSGEVVLLTNQSEPMFLSIPFDNHLLEEAVHVNLAVKLFEENSLTLAKAARLTKMPVESFMEKLLLLGVEIVDQDESEFDEGMGVFKD